jgi:hypothetical protein
MTTTQQIIREYTFLCAALVWVVSAGEIMFVMHQVAPMPWYKVDHFFEELYLSKGKASQATICGWVVQVQVSPSIFCEKCFVYPMTLVLLSECLLQTRERGTNSICWPNKHWLVLNLNPGFGKKNVLTTLSKVWSDMISYYCIFFCSQSMVGTYLWKGWLLLL